jgi:amino acid adenylation domain-containing protein
LPSVKSKPLRIKPSDLARMSTGLHDPVQLLEALEDRKEEKRPDLQETFEPPRTPVEELVAGIWSQVLGVERVGIRDVFFELGGHSLLATQVLSRLRDACKVDLPLRSFFLHPTVAGLAEAVEKARRGPSGPEIPPLRPVSRQGRLPLSFAQQRLWFLYQLEPESAAYNIPAALRLEGALDLPAFRAALDEVVRRHETLRTTFTAVHGEPAQVIAPPAAVPVPVVDLSGLPEDRREPRLRRLVREEALRLFDLARGPLLRVSLAKLDPRQHVAMVTLHHIVGDGWSMEVLVREMVALYESFTQGRPSPLPELPVQYADFTVWQRSWLAGPVLEGEVAWWRERLSGLPPLLEMPLDHPRPAVQTYAGGGCPLLLPAELVRRVRKLAHRQGATLFMALLAAFDALLSRYSGRTDLAVGTPVAGRHYLETETQIGFFANTLVLRADLADGPGLRDLVARTRDAVLEALAHQDLPFERLVEELQPKRDLSYSPLFQVMFELQNRPLDQLQVRGLSFRPLRMERDTAQFDLTLSLLEGESDLIGMITFNRDLFEAATIERLAGHFRTLLETLAAEPDRRFTEAPLWTEAERHQLLLETNDTADVAPDPEGVAALFAAQARRAPDAVAAVCGEEQLTYGALAARVRGLAQALARLGTGPEVRVALLAERGLPLMTAILAVFEAGGAYLPLDPHHPAERQVRLTGQSGAVLVLAERRLAAALRQSLEGLEPAGFPPVLDLESLLGAASAGRDLSDRSTWRGGPGHLAYVIYTSGSTGIPKGAMVEHRGMMNHLLAKISDLGLTAADTVAQTASQCFDISVWQLLAPLVIGGRVHIAGDEIARDPQRLLAFTESEEITILETVPSLLRATLAVSEAAPSRLPALRWLIVTGEAFPADLAGRWLADHPEVPLLNAYGPTECSDDVTHHAIRRAPAPGADLPIGRPLRNFHLYILDRQQTPLPLRIAGELCVAGQGVGRGYLGDPARTAEVFVPDPLCALRGERGTRLYRTGDLARVTPAGTFEFLGRLDTQVKVRGFRVEPGEIEVALCAQPGVRQAVVVARTDGSEGMSLVAYIVPGEPAASAGGLREALRWSLPEYMVPSAFVVLDALPLTPNGKLDRRALPAPGPQAAAGEAPQAARTPVEEAVLGVWADVLGRTRVAGHENFFDLGGHSLLAIQVTSRVRSLLDVEVPLRVLFERPTAARFAESVAEILRAGAGLSAPPLVPVPRDGRPLPASFAQQRLWFLHQLEPASVAYNLPAAVRLEGALDRAALRAALTEIVRRHEALRTRFGVADGAPVQVIDAAGPVDLPLVDLQALPAAAAEEQARLLVRAEGCRPFDLARGPLLRAGLVALGAEEHILSLNMHHVIGDAWSTSVLVRELRELYEACSQGRPSPLPELAVQYADFAVWQRQWLSGEVLEAEIRYWRDRLGVAPPVLELPTDRPRPAVQTFRGTNTWFALPAELSERLQALSRDAGSTLFMALLSAFYALLARYSGQSELVVGTPIAGRNHLETENLIGFFVNTLVLRADLGGDPEFGALLRQVKELTLSSYAHQDLPFEKLVNELQPQRDLSRTPLFQVMFALQNVPAEALESPGLRLQSVPAGSGMSKFDLTGIFFGSGGEGELRGTFEYNKDLFDAATIRRLAEHFQVLLAGLAEEPRRQVSALPLLTGPETAQILREWNDYAKECPQTPMVHELFAGHARQRPWATAVASPTDRLTYGEVEARANRLAHHLRSLGVGPEALVAMCTDRTLERVVGIVAVLKAGGAYVSLDPTYPRERLAFLLADAKAPVLLTERRFVELLPETGAAVICLDTDWDQIQGDASQAPASGVTPDNLAYVVYTSGSTGTPKGVEIPHAGLMNLVRWHQDLYSVAPDDRGTQIASPAFDASIWELWPYLAGGAGVHIPDEETRLSSPGMVRWWSETGITLAYLMTPLAEGVLEVDIPRDLDLQVRALIIGGDRLHRGPDPRVGFRLMNHYGPAEYTVTSTVVQVPPQGEGGGIPTIGRPIDNTQIYILDRALSPVPVGVHGELFVAGVGLARGYLGQPALTAEKFIPDPFAEEPGARMYRTADRVRYLPDGDIDFMGRLDHQVKLRGLRIELGEIESVLGQHPAVREAVVLVREDRPGSKRLAAYVVPAEEEAPGLDELREHLRERLPEYMIPSVFVPMDALPLTPNGKVDRRALPAPEWGAESAYVAPRDPVEEQLAELWCAVLKAERIGIRDDFFEMGGHSLLATQLIARVREAFGVEIPLRSLFQAPTIESFAEVVLARQLQEHGNDDLAELLAELEGLSDEEIAAQLAAEAAVGPAAAGTGSGLDG